MFLSVHRSTVHLAITRKNLAPDYITPGGHYRFKRSTLQAFAETLRQKSATGLARVAEPVRVLGTLADQLMLTGDISAICHEAIRGIKLAEPGIEMIAIVRRVDDARAGTQSTAPIQYEGIAWEGFPAWTGTEFAQVRAVGMGSLAATVLANRQSFVANDTTQQALPFATRTFAAKAQVRSIAILPIIALDQAMGALVAASQMPKQFTPSVIAYLETITRQLALTMRGVDYVTTAQELMARALTIRADIGHSMRATVERQHECARRIEELSHLFRRYTGAQWTWGYNLPGMPPPTDAYPCLADLSRDACRSERQLEGTEWQENGEPYFALAKAFRFSRGQHGVVGAVWHSDRPASHGDLSLLVTYGASCLLATGADNLADTSATDLSS